MNPITQHLNQHLEEAEMSYWSHLTHAFHMSNRLVVVSLKSYVHGVFPFLFKTAGPREVIEMYYEIRRIRHINVLERRMRMREVKSEVLR